MKFYNAMVNRVDEICAEACKLNVPIFIDAEDSWFQSAIDLMAEIAIDFLPTNLVQAVIGGGAIGQALSEHLGVDAVSFTGSVEVGKSVAKAAAGHLAEISLELGGKNPAIFNDCLLYTSPSPRD